MAQVSDGTRLDGLAPRCTWVALDGGVVAVEVADGARGWNRGPGGAQASEGYRMVTEHREPRRSEGRGATELPVTQGRHPAWIACPRTEPAVFLESHGWMQVHRAGGVVGVTEADLAKVADGTGWVTEGDAG